MLKKVIIFVWFITLLITLNQFPKRALDNEIPNFDDFDILYYQPGSGSLAINLYNIETGQTQTLETDLIKPVLSTDHHFLIGLGGGNTIIGGYPQLIDLNRNLFYYCPAGYYNQNYQIDPRTNDPKQFILTTSSTVYLYNFNDCETVEVFIDIRNYKQVLKEPFGIEGAHLSADGETLYFGYRNWKNEKLYLYEFTLHSGVLNRISDGINPVLSHNQQQIVFGKKDGLYLLDLESLTEEKIVDIDPTDKIYPTVPHWSADDSKLVFHTFSGRNTTDNLDFKDCFQIYVYDIKSKTLNELPVKGMDPSWIP